MKWNEKKNEMKKKNEKKMKNEMKWNKVFYVTVVNDIESSQYHL